MLDKVTEIARKTPGVDQVVTIAGVSALDNSAPLANAGVAYIILKDWSERGKGQDLLSLFTGLNKALDEIEEARILVVPPPPIQGIGNAAGFTMQIELRDGSFDLAKLQSVVDAIEANAKTQSGMQRVMASFRASVPQYTVEVDRVKTRDACMSRSTRCSRRSPAISARATSTSSTSSAACSRSMCRPTAQFRLRLGGHPEPDRAQQGRRT